MTSEQPRSQQPSSWTAPERNDGQDAFGRNLSVSFDPESQRHHRSTDNGTYQREQHGSQNTVRRRSSVAERLHALRSAGGPNSIDAFARSWQRAAGFYEIVPVRQSFMYTEGEAGDEENPDYERGEIDTSPMTQRSLLREQLAREERRGDSAVFEEEAAEDPSQRERSPLLYPRSSRSRGDSILQIEPQLSSPFGGSYGSTWGSSSLASRVNESSTRHAGRLFQQQQMTGASEPDKEREPLLVKQVEEEDGTLVNVVIGQSTVPQTVFNSINVLVGVGILALPLAFQLTGWIIGIVFLSFSAVSTAYTARVLAKCCDKDNTIITFTDLALVSYGKYASYITSVLFTIELTGACVALIVLFADSCGTLSSGWIDNNMMKVVCGIIVAGLNFLPLRLLSFTSVLGVFCCIGIVCLVFFDGLWKPHYPGSLHEPAMTTAWPQNWRMVPLGIGLLMSPWGGHAVFPSIYRDMRHPFRYHQAVSITYIFTFCLIMFMAVIGWLMFGDLVRDEITQNVINKSIGYPRWVGIVIIVLIAIVPLTKVPLNARPILSTIEIYLGLDPRTMAEPESLNGLSVLSRGISKVVTRIIITFVFVGLAILVPDFDKIMGLLGSLCCFTICIVLPCTFHLKLYWSDLTALEKGVDFGLVALGTVLAVVCTAWTFIPLHVLRAALPL